MHGVRAQPLALDHLRIILLDAQRRELPQQDPAQTWLEVVPDDVGIAVVGGVFQVGPYDLLQPVVQPRPNGDGLGRREPPSLRSAAKVSTAWTASRSLRKVLVHRSRRPFFPRPPSK